MAKSYLDSTVKSSIILFLIYRGFQGLEYFAIVRDATFSIIGQHTLVPSLVYASAFFLYPTFCIAICQAYSTVQPRF